jgi:hypothetical protein
MLNMINRLKDMLNMINIEQGMLNMINRLKKTC